MNSAYTDNLGLLGDQLYDSPLPPGISFGQFQTFSQSHSVNNLFNQNPFRYNEMHNYQLPANESTIQSFQTNVDSTRNTAQSNMTKKKQLTILILKMIRFQLKYQNEEKLL
jgi:hypothetical protein